MTTNKIIEACAQAWGVTPADVLGRCRRAEVMEPRHYARWIMYVRKGMTSQAVASVFGCTHASVLNSLSRVWEWNGRRHYRERSLADKVDEILKGEEV